MSFSPILGPMIPPFAPAVGQPPTRVWTFFRWALRGAWRGIVWASIWSVVVGSFEAVSATLLVFLSLFAGVIMARAGQQPMLPGLGPILRGAVGAALAGYGLTLLTTYVAIVFGVWMRVRMWLGESQWLARSGRYWPPARAAATWPRC